ncbi:hypothetical protein OFM39_33565, partial [Escherichia coli]|nr:hypothetical protein [Escherichia coli]
TFGEQRWSQILSYQRPNLVTDILSSVVHPIIIRDHILVVDADISDQKFLFADNHFSTKGIKVNAHHI